MKIVLSHGYFLHEDEKELEIMRPYPTLGLLYISAFLKQHKKNVTVYDSTFNTRENWFKEIEKIKPDVIALYANLMTKINIIQLQQEIKKKLPSVKVIAGGPDVTYNIDNYLKAGFDFGIIGEGEQTALELIEAIEQGSDFNEVDGIAFLKDGVTKINTARTKMRSLEELPLPDREAIPLEKYLTTWEKHHGKRTLNISTQRGCPYSCKWCSTAVYGQSYRRNTPQNVVKEVLYLKEKFNAEALWFVDDVFTVSHKWIDQLHQEFKKHKLVIPFEIITRAERLTEAVLDQLKEMGCFRIWIGAESGSQKIIDKMDRRVKLETVQEMINQTRKRGMEAGTFIMVGYPDELQEDITATLQHITACNPNQLTITKAYPIKGTDLYQEVEKDFTTNLNWETSTDRDIKFKLPYSDKYYSYAIRYLVNGWQAKKNNSWKNKLKRDASFLMMNILK